MRVPAKYSSSWRCRLVEHVDRAGLQGDAGEAGPRRVVAGPEDRAQAGSRADERERPDGALEPCGW